jgi:hypothetical protein
MPMVMMSGWIAADALDQNHRGTDAAGAARRQAEQLLAGFQETTNAFSHA